MLKTLRLHNFRTFLNAGINFTQRHLLIGANNSGKTNLCAALRFLGKTASSDLATSVQETIPGGISEIRNWALESSIDVFQLSCTCELPFDGQPHLYAYDLKLRVGSSGPPSQEGPPVLRVAQEKLVVNGPGFRDITLLENDGHDAHMGLEGSDEGSTAKTLAPSDATMLSKLYKLETNRRAVSFRDYLSSWMYFAFNPEAIRYGWRTPLGLFELTAGGEHVAASLYELKSIDERRYRRVLELVQLIEPDLEAVNFYPTPDPPRIPLVHLRHNPKASWNGLSDGTLLCFALALITELVAERSDLAPLQPSPLVIIEEPENGIYPGALRKFFDLLEDRTLDRQFVFTSHSPYFINFFDGSRDSVTLLRRNKEHTEIIPVPPAEDDPEREMLAEQYSMELF